MLICLFNEKKHICVNNYHKKMRINTCSPNSIIDKQIEINIQIKCSLHKINQDEKSVNQSKAQQQSRSNTLYTTIGLKHNTTQWVKLKRFVMELLKRVSRSLGRWRRTDRIHGKPSNFNAEKDEIHTRNSTKQQTNQHTIRIGFYNVNTHAHQRTHSHVCHTCKRHISRERTSKRASK